MTLAIVALGLAFTGFQLPSGIKDQLVEAAAAHEQGRQLSEAGAGLAAFAALLTCAGDGITLGDDFTTRITAGDLSAISPLCASDACIAALSDLGTEMSGFSEFCVIVKECPTLVSAALSSSDAGPSAEVVAEVCKSSSCQSAIRSASFCTSECQNEFKQCDSDDDPCFARDTFAISPDGATIPMASLKSGDLVMDGPSSVTRVILNQHRETTFKSTLLELSHANGELSLTPDHVLEIDGEFVPARMASAGSKLGESEVSRVTTKAGEVINPLTTSGKILTQGGVLATTYPEWIAEYMLSSYLVPLPLSLSNVVSYVFPETTQAYYDALIEPLVTKAHPKHLKAALPSELVPLAFLVGDVALTSGFFGFALASPMMLILAAAVAVAAKARK